MDKPQESHNNGAAASAIRGRRGQAFLREMLDALDAMPKKRLIRWTIMTRSGRCCALGALCAARGMSLDKPSVECYDETLSQWLGIPDVLTQKIVFENDKNGPPDETDERRWVRIREWILSNLEKAH